ncbi:MAG: VWA domain-containing protein [Planctomycetes bacterium]|nr:VWA domain-containing protein [Planctomycetota bacterium]MCC7171393.1 VWA domain-containing protein [Planctomycetota bacterium]
MLRSFVASIVGFLAFASAPPLRAQAVPDRTAFERGAGSVLVPQGGSVVIRDGAARVGVLGVAVDIDVVGQVATTTLRIALNNPTRVTQEIELMLPVPRGAVVRGFDFAGRAPAQSAEVLPAQRARALYDSIVSRAKDPALLEFADFDTLRSSVFPVNPGTGLVVKVVYEHVLVADGDRIDYTLPRSESLGPNWIPWTVEVRIRAPRPIAAIYSPTHAMTELRASPAEARLRLDATAAREPGPVRFSWLLEGKGLNATLYVHPDARIGGGYFLLLCGLPPAPADAPKTKREVLIVLDRSGSMRGEKFEQARAAAMQILAGLEDGEWFNVLDYSSSVALFAAQPVQRTDDTIAKAKAYLERLVPDGGTDIQSALTCVLRQNHTSGTHPIVLFLTDGLPTVGITDEVRIRSDAVAENRHARRVFTFGVGHDVNAPLLDQVAIQSRAASTYVQPAENVEAKVSEVYRRLHGPRLAAPTLRVLDEHGVAAPHRVADIEPRALADLYDGDQILVLGRLRGEGDVVFEVEGDQLGQTATFRFPFRMHSTADDCAFVPRLWASRRIATLLDDLRMSGADPKVALTRGAQDGEIAREIYALSTEFGILTEYTSFLAQEGSVLADEAGNLARMNDQLQNRLRMQRAGRDAVRQAMNTQRLRDQQRLNRRNRQLDQTMNETAFDRVAQVGQRAFFSIKGRWVDSRLARRAANVPPDDTMDLASDRARLALTSLDGGSLNGVYSLGGDVLLDIGGKAVLFQRTPTQQAPAIADPTASPPIR